MSGARLLARTRELADGRGVRRIVIETSRGQSLFELAPPAAGVGPLWVAVAAIGALPAEYKIRVERVDPT